MYQRRYIILATDSIVKQYIYSVNRHDRLDKILSFQSVDSAMFSAASCWLIVIYATAAPGSLETRQPSQVPASVWPTTQIFIDSYSPFHPLVTGTRLLCLWRRQLFCT